MNPIDDFLKEAGILGTLGSAFKRGVAAGVVDPNTKGAIAKGMAGGFGRALNLAGTGALLTAGAVGAAQAYDGIKDRLTKTRDYKSMLEATPALRKYDAGQVQMVYNTLRNQAPSLSKDPLLAGSFVRKTLEVSPESGPFVDVATAKTLSDTQKNLTEARDKRGPISEAFKPYMRPGLSPLDAGKSGK